MFVDAHCHLPSRPEARAELESLLDRARAADVGGLVAVGTDLEDSREVLALVRTLPWTRACLGVHPHEAKTWEVGTEAALATLLREPEVCFVGETGLDWHYDLSPREVQEDVFRAQIRLARKLRKPLMVHTRSAPEATLRILRDEGAGNAGGVIHCFSEDRAFAEQVLDLGFYLSFSGIVTFKRAEAIQEVAAWAPLDRILVETDAPYLAPVPYRGKPNEPAFVPLVAAKIAALRGISLHRVAAAALANLEALCGWSPSF